MRRISLDFLPNSGRNILFRTLGFSCFIFLFSSLAFFLGFILLKAGYSISEFGVSNFFGNWHSGQNSPNTSIYSPLVYTLILVIFSVWVTNKLAIKVAKYLLKLQEKYRRWFIHILKFSSLLPSFITSFILFEAIVPTLTLYGLIPSYSIIWIILCFFSILFPTSCLSYINCFSTLEAKALNSALLNLALDERKRNKIQLKCSYKIIYFNIGIALIKALGESVALSWFLSSDRYDKPFSSFYNFLNTEVHTISSLISSFYFSEGGGRKNKDAMYVFGAALLIVSISLNWLLKRKALETDYKESLLSKKFKFLKSRLRNRLERHWYPNPLIYLSRYLKQKTHIYSYEEIKWKWTLRKIRNWKEKISIFLVLFFFSSILGIAVFRGIYFIFFKVFSGSTESYSLEGLVVPTWNTILLLFFSISWALPITFLSAFFSTTYLKKKKKIKSFFSSIISGVGTTPPMLWAMFSSFFFLNYLKLGIGKTSVFAGILSFTILSFPALFNKFSNLFENYSQKYSRTLSYLGLQQFQLVHLVLRDGKDKIKKHLSELSTKLNGESGLLFITVGASPSSRFTLWGNGQTLTTKFFTTFYKYKILDLRSTLYETIFFVFVFSIFLYSLLTTFWIRIFTRFVGLIKKIYLKSKFRYYWNINVKNRMKFLMQLNSLK